MATGAGKTRTVIALCDLLMRSNWVKRVLFLADRVALVNQAVNAFKTHLPDVVAGQSGDREGRRGPGLRLDLPDHDGPDRRDAATGSGASASGTSISSSSTRRTAPFTRSTGAIFDYFDSLLVGLTATPKDEVDRNTYGLFDLENGVPTDAYASTKRCAMVPRAAAGGLGAAQVPARRHQVRRPLRGGEGAVGRDGLGRGRRRPDAGRGRGGQQVAVQQGHRRQGAGAPDDATASRSPAATGSARPSSSPRTTTMPTSSPSGSTPTTRSYKGAFARVITSTTEYAQSLIDDFSSQDKAPHIADLRGHARHRHRHARRS